MTLRSILNTSSPSAEPINPITASRLAHAASREIPSNLFRLLVDLSSTEAAGQAPPSPDEDADLGPPWDDDTTVTEAAVIAGRAVVPADA